MLNFSELLKNRGTSIGRVVLCSPVNDMGMPALFVPRKLISERGYPSSTLLCVSTHPRLTSTTS